jgi:nitrite reductase/ring-hydroxylating ferredoxin subunit
MGDSMPDPQQKNDTRKECVIEGKSLLHRRVVVRLAWIIGALVFFGGQLWIILKLFFGAKSSPYAPGPVQVGRADQFAIGSVTHFWKERFLLVRQPTGFLALSHLCTHSVCNVDYLPEQRVIYCPCHGARFSLTGEVLMGPATRPLDRFAATVRNGQVVVDTSRRLPPQSSY